MFYNERCRLCGIDLRFPDTFRYFFLTRLLRYPVDYRDDKECETAILHFQIVRPGRENRAEATAAGYLNSLVKGI
jgi:hypothetical protein